MADQTDDQEYDDEEMSRGQRASLFASEYGQWMAGAIVFITFVTWIGVSIVTGWELEGIGSYRADANFMATLNNLGTMIVGGALSLGGAAMSSYRSSRKGKPVRSEVKMDIPAMPLRSAPAKPPSDLMQSGVSAQATGRPPVPPKG